MDPGMAMMAISTLISLLNPGGKDAQTKSTYNKAQKGGINDIMNAIKGMGGPQDITQNPNYQGGMNWLTGLFSDPQFFEQFEAPLQRQFQEQTIPDLANRFASMGTHGSFGSGFQNAAAREGSRLHESLGALRGGLQQQGVNQSLGYAQQPFQNIMSLYNTGLSHPTQNVYQPASNPFAPIAGASAQGYFQGQGMNNRFPGQSPSTV
jgi:hypothetical protein